MKMYINIWVLVKNHLQYWRQKMRPHDRRGRDVQRPAHTSFMSLRCAFNLINEPEKFTDFFKQRLSLSRQAHIRTRPNNQLITQCLFKSLNMICYSGLGHKKILGGPGKASCRGNFEKCLKMGNLHDRLTLLLLSIHGTQKFHRPSPTEHHEQQHIIINTH